MSAQVSLMNEIEGGSRYSMGVFRFPAMPLIGDVLSIGGKTYVVANYCERYNRVYIRPRAKLDGMRMPKFVVSAFRFYRRQPKRKVENVEVSCG